MASITRLTGHAEPMYPILASLFFLNLASVLVFLTLFIFFRTAFRKTAWVFAICWALYLGFIVLFCGPQNLNEYPPRESSIYKLPWQAGVSRFIAQGNRSFTSHRDFHEYAWDFAMPIGTEVLSAADGEVIQIEDRFTGIGLNSNFLKIRHASGEVSLYAHIQKALVHLGDRVGQGQPIALSGMVGQTIFPHLHFVVLNPTENQSIPISFADVIGGVPLAGRYYQSGAK